MYKRLLNDKQHASLDRVAVREPKAVVVGWEQFNSENGGPVVLVNGVRKTVGPSGYLRATVEESVISNGYFS